MQTFLTHQVHESFFFRNGIKRFIGMSSWATQDRPDLPFFLRWILRPIFLKKVLDNLNEMELYLEKTDINYTIVRPPGLTDGELVLFRVSLVSWLDS